MSAAATEPAATATPPGSPPPSAWAQDAGGPVRRGPGPSLPVFAALPRLLRWVSTTRALFDSPRPEVLEHLKTADWFLDNHVHIQRAVRQVLADMPAGFLRRLPVLTQGPHAGCPRASVLAAALLQEAGLLPDAASARALVNEFQETAALTTAELWALPVFLRLGTLERLAEAIARVLPQQPSPLPPALLVGRPTRLDEDECVARCVRSLRTLDMLDWNAFFEACSVVERILENDPGAVHARSDFATRDACRKRVEAIAWGARVGESVVADAAVELAREQVGRDAAGACVAGVLLGPRQRELERRFGWTPPLATRLLRALPDHGSAVLLGSIAVATALVLVLPAVHMAHSGAGALAWLAALALSLVPASTLGITIVHGILTSLLPPRVLPKLDFSDAIDADCRTLVVMPCLLGSAREVDDLVRQLETQRLRNSDPHLAFALLTDWLDAPEQRQPDDDALLQRAADGIRGLDEHHGDGDGGPFHLLHRERRWNPAEGAWMGWERKRGKLEELDELLLGTGRSRLQHVVGAPRDLEHVRFVITLDAGTVLPTGAAARLVGTLAHPLNRARFDEHSGRVVGGYTVLQPRVEVAPTAVALSAFTRAFSGDAEIDIYSRAVSDVYQDVCGQGIYVGKGIYDVSAFARSLAGRVPQNALVSHDHFEGLHGRAALASDIVLYEDYPPQYLAYARRLQRWIRGDWQLLPWLRGHVPDARGERVPTRLSLLGRWILFDNLRRSLLAPTLLVMLVSAWLWLPGSPLLWTLLALLAPAGHIFTGLVAGLVRGPRRLRARTWLARVGHTLRQSVGRWLLFVVFLPHEALLTIDAIARTLTRVFVTHRHLLEWRSAEHTARLLARRRPRALAWREMAGSPVIAVVLLAAIGSLRVEMLPWAAPLLATWVAAPELARFISRPTEAARHVFGEQEITRLRSIARRTWLFFETVVGPADQWLPPDNEQVDPHPSIAHRTSPTNVGMYLVSTVAAHDLGWIGPTDLAIRVRSTLDSLDRMEHYRGHLYNWYDTQTLEPLLPRYVSAVDSGNLAAALLVVGQACAEVVTEPLLGRARWQGMLDDLGLLEEGVRRTGSSGPAPDLRRTLACSEAIRARVIEAQADPRGWAPALQTLGEQLYPALDEALVEGLRQTGRALSEDTLHELRIWLERSHNHLRAMRREWEQLAPWQPLLDGAPAGARGLPFLGTAREQLQPDLALAQLAPACEQVLAGLEACRGQAGPADATVAAWLDELAAALARGAQQARALEAELLAFGGRIDACVGAMDFRLLYDRVARLLHIGYDVTNGSPDPNHYDLLASEARVASFLAIAKGDVPVEHWFYLRRPMTRFRGRPTLLSWGGTMFEYLMPSLFLHSGDRTLLGQSCRVAVDAQVDYGRRRGVPWGISESGFHLFDPGHSYQYRAFGVPGLGLRRGLADDLVIAAYASISALYQRPRAVLDNIERLASLGGLGTHGFYEALDFTPDRVPAGERAAVVRSHMAHHQGMILAAIDNALRPEPLVRRFHATSLARSAELLLHEQVPAGVSPQMHPEPVLAPLAPAAPRREPQPWRPALDGPVPQTLLLSNGRLTSALTDSGGGFLNWRGLAVTRWRADPTCDDCGSWMYLRDEDSGDLWSVGAQPCGGDGAERHVIAQAHMAEYQRRDRGLFVRMEVSVAPRDDLELRLVSVTNESDRTRRLTLCSCLEPVLAPGAEHERHPAFSRLFLESAKVPGLHALRFRRRPRRLEERPAVLIHALLPGHGVSPAGHETDRLRFLGRGHDWRAPAALTGGRPLARTTGRVLDPVSVLRVATELRPGAHARLACVTVVAGAESAALDVLRRFRSLEQLEWIVEDARSAVARDLQSLRVMPRMLPAIQQLQSLIVNPHPAWRCHASETEANRLGQPGLWGLGISGDEPLLLVEIGEDHGTRLLSEVLLAHRAWRRSGLAADLVVLLTQPSGYSGDDEDRVARLVAQSGSAEWRNRRGGVFLLRADRLGRDELRLLRVTARVVLRSENGRLAAQLEPREPAPARPPRFVPPFSFAETAEPTPALEPPGPLLLPNDWGGFSPDGREYVIRLPPGATTPAPWCNVLANPQFGCLVSESGLGSTWSGNSAERRLTPWRNDPVSDAPSEVLYLRDEETGAVWTPTPLPAGSDAETHVRHGAGCSTYHRASHGLDHQLSVFVPRHDPLKVVTLRLRNTWQRPRRLTVTYYAELVLGTRREIAAPFCVPEYESELGVLLARNPWNPERAERVTFLASDGRPHGVTTDRTEFLGRRGRLARPAALDRWGLSGSVRTGVDPCLALMLHVELAPGQEHELHFLLGDGPDREQALEIVRRYRSREAVAAAREELRSYWDGLLGAIEVKTPEPAMDLALNRWLLYQVVASRLEGRTALYQSSGAFGFRDQLQDVMALVHAAPERARAHVLEAAGRQFEDGDVLHWWHPPEARGMRTRCSDDLLWLPFVACHYALATGDLGVFREQRPFLVGEPLADGETERYATFAEGTGGTLLDHCRRALQRGLTEGPHGLPRIGSCDWNDGFDRVGPGGSGESVWLAWFGIATAEGFARVLEQLGEHDEAALWSQRAQELGRAVERSAWDGEWYLRAWFDDGTPLGSAASEECRIDLIAQAWAAISGAGSPERVDQALAAAVEHLAPPDDQLVRLLWPPFDTGPQDPGYIKAYPPGVRENGGQYTHAATWLGWAFATRGDGASAERVFRHINPLERARDRRTLRRYRVEPYVVAGDVYGCPPHRGRGGWTWYTGSASWLWRLGVEAVLGLRREGGQLVVAPCIPPSWPGFEAVVRTPAARVRVLVENPEGVGHGVRSMALDGELLPAGRLPLDTLEGAHELRVTLGRVAAESRPA